ncbi:hypothetical protein OU415_11955 [Saccharopolyspora sp. WRP15-2]|uniref:Uncharacterized protein n=1 Tax=Saccharopolyspora oryzae TaxID=2997343 RepID=A0ABT4UWR7_9PSEU|nr:hypothetical protein [Saccharopolyspora oryzae]MDA3626152.1 hypothetical protein [Saccharopolyspora oryzae]
MLYLFLSFVARVRWAAAVLCIVASFEGEAGLPDVDRYTLLQWSRRANTSQALALRSKIVLTCAEGRNNKDVAARQGIRPHTVENLKERREDRAPQEEASPEVQERIRASFENPAAPSIDYRWPDAASHPLSPRTADKHQHPTNASIEWCRHDLSRSSVSVGGHAVLKGPVGRRNPAEDVCIAGRTINADQLPIDQ